MPGAVHFEKIVGESDPTVRAEAADRSATLLVRGPRSPQEAVVVERIVHLVDTEGLEEIAELWSASAPESLAGSLWRLFLLRSWVYADPAAAARQFDEGRRHSPVREVVAGVPSPPGPDEVLALADKVLRGIRVGDYADTLFRAAAFAHLAASGRAHLADDTSGPAGDLSASRLMTLAQQLEAAGHRELGGGLV